MTHSNAGYWYLNRHMLTAGQIFRTLKGSLVKLDRRVDGDGTKWHVADWHNCWSDNGNTIEPSELSSLPLPEPTVEGFASTPKADGYHFLISPDGSRSAWIPPQDLSDPKFAGWTDCTTMSTDELQRHVAERQAVRPYIVGVAVGA